MIWGIIVIRKNNFFFTFTHPDVHANTRGVGRIPTNMQTRHKVKVLNDFFDLRTLPKLCYKDT